MRQYKGEASWHTMRLAARNPSGILLGAATARLAAELVRRHGSGSVPSAEIDAATQRFGQWLTHAVETPRMPAPMPEDC